MKSSSRYHQRVPRRPRNDLTDLARSARDQLKRATALGRSLDIRMEAKQNAAEGWVPDDAWRADFADVTSVIVQCGNALTKALEGNKKKLGGMKTEELEAQFKAEMIRSAETLTPEEWAMLDRVRQKKGMG